MPKKKKYDPMAPPPSAKEVAAAAGSEYEQSFYGFIDVPLVVTIEMPSAILDADTMPRKDFRPPGDQDVRVIEVKPEIEFRRFLSMVSKEYNEWCKGALYKGPGSSPAFKVGEGHPPLGLYTVEQSHCLHAQPVAGAGQVIHGDVGVGKLLLIDVIEKYYRRPWTAIQVQFSCPMDSNKAIEDESKRQVHPSSPPVVGDESQYLHYFRVCQTVPVLDKRLLHAHSVAEAIVEKRAGSPLRAERPA